MIVGRGSTKKLEKYYQEKSRGSISYALSAIQKSRLAPYVDAIYLYGSCARCEQNRYSDVDLLLQLTGNTDTKLFHSDIMQLHGAVIPPNPDLPEVDLKVVVGSAWKTSSDLYYRNVRRDGVQLC